MKTYQIYNQFYSYLIHSENGIITDSGLMGYWGKDVYKGWELVKFMRHALELGFTFRKIKT